LQVTFPRLAKVAILTTNADAENNVEYSRKCQAEYCTATFAKRVLAVVFLSNFKLTKK